MVTDFPYARLRPGSRLQRAGGSRFKFVQGEGWFVEMREGTRGPFVDKRGAAEYLADFLSPKALGALQEGVS